ncbi:MAG: glycerol-3-phosphate acyltransferase [Deinococcus sp.]|nr:glycerol-3-phosphate acyltransferase [Deinococcus sp.]
MGTVPLLILAGAYALGSLPLGWLLVKLVKRLDARDYASHNIGIEQTLRVLGPVAAAASLLDALKGAASLVIAWRVSPGALALALAGIGVYLGHLYPVALDLPWRWRRHTRGRGSTLLLGVLLGLGVAGEVPWWVVLPPPLLWLGVTLSSRYPTLGFAAALVTSVLLSLLGGLPFPYVLLTSVVTALALWRSKENIGRMLDGVEVRLGSPAPVAGLDDEIACAFLVHALTPDDWWQANRFAWLHILYRWRLLPLGLVKRLVAGMRPMKMDELTGIVTRDGHKVRVYLLGAPFLPDQIRSQPELAVQRAIQAAWLTKELGADTLGLGAFWSTVGNKGLDVQAQAPVHVTNGGAYTAGTVKVAIPQILEQFRAQGRSLSQAVAAVVGANGVVGFGICRTVAPVVRKLYLVGHGDVHKMDRSRETLARANPSTEIVATTDLAVLQEADLIFTATSDPDPVVYPQHVKPGTWIYDLGRPADVHPSVLQMSGVRVIPGGVVRPPGQLRGRLDIHFGNGYLPACLAETIIMAVTRAYERASLGPSTKSENIDFYVEQAERLGFTVAQEIPTPPLINGAPPASAAPPP